MEAARLCPPGPLEWLMDKKPPSELRDSPWLMDLPQPPFLVDVAFQKSSLLKNI